MIIKLSKTITNYLTTRGYITTDEIELYEYAASILCCLIAPFVIVSALIPITGLKYEGYILVIPFTLLRRYCGGFHFKNDNICLLVSTFYLLIIEEIGVKINVSKILIVSSAICLFLLYCIGIRKTACYSVSMKKRRICSLTIICLVFYLFIISTLILDECYYSKWICLGIIMAIILQVPDLIIKLNRKKRCI